MNEQSHPLYSIDRNRLTQLLGVSSPSNADFVDLARFLIRYKDFNGANDLKSDIQRILKHWSLSEEDLNSKTREIWLKGYRPGGDLEEGVGSGFDATEDSNN